MYTQRQDSPLKCTRNNAGGRRGGAARKQKRKPWVSEESKLLGWKLTVHRGQDLVLLRLLKTHQTDVHVQKRKGKRKAMRLD